MRGHVSLLAALLLAVTGCGSVSEDRVDSLSVCDLVSGDLIESVIGPASTTSFDLAPLFECTWTGDVEVVTVRVEVVPDAKLFIEHAVEGTNPERVVQLDGDLEGGVLFVDEAVALSTGNVVVLVDGSVPTEQLVPLAAAATAALPANCKFTVTQDTNSGTFSCI